MDDELGQVQPQWKSNDYSVSAAASQLSPKPKVRVFTLIAG
jgi:hypothetical protein